MIDHGRGGCPRHYPERHERCPSRRTRSLPQERRIVTEIPGPKSRALHARKEAAVSDGIGVGLPVYVKAAGGGVIVDVDGNSLIDMAAGIAVTSVGNAAPEVVEAVSAQVAQFTHTCFMVAPYEPATSRCASCSTS